MVEADAVIEGTLQVLQVCITHIIDFVSRLLVLPQRDIFMYKCLFVYDVLRSILYNNRFSSCFFATPLLLAVGPCLLTEESNP